MTEDGAFFGIIDNDQGIANVAVVAVEVVLWGACDGVVLAKLFKVVVCRCFRAGEAAGVDVA